LELTVEKAANLWLSMINKIDIILTSLLLFYETMMTAKWKSLKDMKIIKSTLNR